MTAPATITSNGQRTTNALLASALSYARMGLAVFPCHGIRHKAECTCRRGRACPDAGKHPRTPHGLSDATTDEDKINQWWTKWPNANVAIRTGAESGVWALDKDTHKGGEIALDDLISKYGELPATVEAITGGGGSHLLFKHPGQKVKTTSDQLGPGLDVRGDGGYIIASPSIHASGRTYEWESSADPDNMDVAEAPFWLLRLVCADPETPEKPSSVVSGVSVVSGSEAKAKAKNKKDIKNESESEKRKAKIEQVINETVPDGPGQRNLLVLSLARGLKFDAGLADEPLTTLKPYVRRWWKMAFPNIGTEDFDTTWFDFIHSFERAKFPLSIDIATAAFNTARDSPPAPEAEQYDSADVQLLVTACRELQRLKGVNADGKPLAFSLSWSQVARHLWADESDVHRRKAGRWLRGLAADGVIEVVTPGVRGRPGSPATRYIYTGDCEDDDRPMPSVGPEGQCPPEPNG